MTVKVIIWRPSKHANPIPWYRVAKEIDRRLYTIPAYGFLDADDAHQTVCPDNKETVWLHLLYMFLLDKDVFDQKELCDCYRINVRGESC